MRSLSAAFADCPIDYEFANDLHRFKLHWGPTHWLYVPRSFVDGRTGEELHESLKRWRIVDAFGSSQRSRCLLLGERGVLEVNNNYGRGRRT